MEKKTFEILNRESWLKVFVISLFSIVVAYKIFASPLEIDISDFSFSDLLAMVLSIFAIGMSVAFYFKATDTSNQFYDNSYKFTKEMSEVLGRIESGFGERLKHIDEGYSGLKDKLYQSTDNQKKAEEAIDKEEELVANKEKERQKLIEELAIRAKLDDEEKKKLFSELRNTELALQKAKKEIDFMRHQIFQGEEHRTSDGSIPSRVNRYIKTRVIESLGGIEEVARLSMPALKSRFDVVSEDFNPSFLEDCNRHNLVSENGLLPAGAKYIRRIARTEGNTPN